MRYQQKSKWSGNLREQQGKGIVDIYSSGFVTTLKNIISPSDANARPGFVGEKHQILKLPNGKLGIANYSGPGTSIIKRIRRADPPRTKTDKTAQAHDLRYSLFDSDKSMRNADVKMVNKLKSIERKGSDSRLNTVPARLAITSKMKLEDMGLLSRDAFKNLKKINPDDRRVLLDKLNELEQEGYGQSRQSNHMDNKPASKLRRKVMNMITLEGKKAQLSAKKIDFNKIQRLSKTKKNDFVKKMLMSEKLRPLLINHLDSTLEQSDSVSSQTLEQTGTGKKNKKTSIWKKIKDVISTGADIAAIAAKVAPFIALLL